jgi:cytosine/adenosine deaminase-related metal-dependent hydrolase
LKSLVIARWIGVDPDTWVEGGGVLLRGGRVERVLSGPAAVRRARRDARVVDHGDTVLTAGLVNAHAHLELSGLAGALPAGRGYRRWVEELVTARGARGARRLAADARRGLGRAIETGTTTLVDNDATGAVRGAAGGRGPRLVVLHELLDAGHGERAAAALEPVRRAPRARARVRHGLAPHAPHTASPELLAGAARLARRRGATVSVHWSETPEERRWLEEGTGPLTALLGGALGSSPRTSGLDLLEDAGLLGPRTLLVHGNEPARGEPARIAAAGATVVHCPGCHAWFGRDPFPLARYQRAGVRVVLGTDSLASNDDLSMPRELALLRRAHPGLAPRDAWAMATEEAGLALGGSVPVGVLHPGAYADLALFACGETRAGALLDVLTGGEAEPLGAWVAGSRVRIPSRARTG